jgi:acyl-CoA thioesterase-2
LTPVVNDLLASLEVEEIGSCRYRFPSPPEGRGVVFGGHLLAQMCLAGASAAAAQGSTGTAKTVRSAHGVFARSVRADEPHELSVDVLHTGRVLTSMSVSIRQAGTECARGLVLMTEAEPDLMRHQAAAPDVGPPDNSPVLDDPFGRELRVVGGLDRSDPDVVAPPRLSVWLRFPSLPIDAVLSQALVAHSTAGFLMGTAMLPHAGIGERMAHRSFSTGIIAHTVSFHDDIDIARWLLITQDSTHAGRGRAYGIGQVFTEGGIMVASFNQEAIIRPFPEGHSPEGRESTVL